MTSYPWKSLSVKQIGIILLALSLVAQSIGGALFLYLKDFALIDQGDTREYITVADNVIAGHGYSAEEDAPWRPTASRSPLMLLTNVPLRYFFSDSDLLAMIVGRLIQLAVALLTIVIARFFLKNGWEYVAAAAITIIPTTAYYGVNPYASGPVYLLSFTIMFAGLVWALRGRWYGVLVVALGCFYSMGLRPAALFPLLTLIAGSLVLSLIFRARDMRRRLWLIALAGVVGTVAIYVPWSLRNQRIFDSFQYSSVGGFNLLHFNVLGMRPYLDAAGQQKVDEALEALPIYIHRYHGPEQIEISLEQGDAAAAIIREYPGKFLQSHLIGSLEGFLLFKVDILEDLGGQLPTLAIAAVQTVMTLVALIGVLGRLRTGDAQTRALILLMGGIGVISVLSGGALSKPKFRIPLEPLVAIGMVIFIYDFVVARFQKKPDTAERSTESSGLDLEPTH